MLGSLYAIRGLWKAALEVWATCLGSAILMSSLFWRLCTPMPSCCISTCYLYALLSWNSLLACLTLQHAMTAYPSSLLLSLPYNGPVLRLQHSFLLACTIPTQLFYLLTACASLCSG